MTACPQAPVHGWRLIMQCTGQPQLTHTKISSSSRHRTLVVGSRGGEDQGAERWREAAVEVGCCAHSRSAWYEPAMKLRCMSLTDDVAVPGSTMPPATHSKLISSS